MPFGETQVFVQNHVHKFVQIRWTFITGSNYCFTTCSNCILTTSEICQMEHTIETEANLITHDTYTVHQLQLPLKLRIFLRQDWRQSKSHYVYAWRFTSKLFRCEHSLKTIVPIIHFVYLLSGSRNCRFYNKKHSLSTDMG